MSVQAIDSIHRMINTLLHQYFIEGGIKEKEAKKTTFQKTLSLA